MFKLKLLDGWRNPQDGTAFDTHYEAAYAMRALTMPGLVESTVARSHDREQAPFRVVAAGSASVADGPNLRSEAVS